MGGVAEPAPSVVAESRSLVALFAAGRRGGGVELSPATVVPYVIVAVVASYAGMATMDSSLTSASITSRTTVP